MWERLVAANYNAAAESRFRKNISNGNLGFVYKQLVLLGYLKSGLPAGLQALFTGGRAWILCF